MVETINKLLRTQRRMTQELNREPTIEELAKELEMEPEKVEYVMKIKQDISSLDAGPLLISQLKTSLILLPKS